MKKIATKVLIILFMVIAPAYAGISKSQAADGNEYSRGESYGNTHATSRSSSNYSSSGGYSDYHYDDLYDRPGGFGEDGIGEENAPVGDGITILIVSCVLLVIVKLLFGYGNKRIYLEGAGAGGVAVCSFPFPLLGTAVPKSGTAF